MRVSIVPAILLLKVDCTLKHEEEAALLTVGHLREHRAVKLVIDELRAECTASERVIHGKSDGSPHETDRGDCVVKARDVQHVSYVLNSLSVVG